MKQTFPYLPVLLLFACWQVAGPPQSQAPAQARAQASAQAPAPAATGPSRLAAAGDGSAVLRAAIAGLRSHASIAARVRYRLNVFDQSLVGHGQYFQQGQGVEMKIRLELQTQIAGGESSLQQVADGRYLWIDQQWDDHREVTRINLNEVRQALATQPAAENSNPARQLTIGGLPRLLHSLQRRFTFGTAEPIMLGELPAWALVGKWRAAQKADPSNPDAADSDDDPASGQLADHVPEEVLLVLARDDLFPHVVEFRRPSNDPAGGRKTLVRLELFEVQVDQPIDYREFAYAAGASSISNGTARFLRENHLVDPASR